MTKYVHSCLDPGGESTYTLAHLTPLSLHLYLILSLHETLRDHQSYSFTIPPAGDMKVSTKYHYNPFSTQVETFQRQKCIRYITGYMRTLLVWLKGTKKMAIGWKNEALKLRHSAEKHCHVAAFNTAVHQQLLGSYGFSFKI